MVEVYGVKIDKEIDKAKFSRFIACIGEEKREKVKKYYHFDDKLRALIGNVLTRYLICKKLLLDNKHLVFDQNEFGKPFLVNSSRIHFNISHSGEWVLCAVHDLPVGIDVEKIQPLDYQVAGRYFSKDEYLNLSNKDGRAKLQYFYEIWTLKESYIKAIGMGLSIPLESFSFLINEDEIIIETEKRPGVFYFKQYNLDKRYKIAVCAMANMFMKSVTIIDIDELYNWALLA